MTDTQAATIEEMAATDQAERAAITEWIEANIGGTVNEIERVRRWRPIWHVHTTKDGEPRSYIVKSERAWDSIPFSLDHEMHMTTVLEKHGLPVAHIHGMMAFPKAFVMDWVVSDTRDAGLIQQSIELGSSLSPERWAASLESMEWLAKAHKIPPEEFCGPELTVPVGAEDVALNYYNRYYKMLEDRDIRDPMMMFFTHWIRRNYPRHRSQPCFNTGDCGQFLNKGDKVVAMIDFEVGHLSDHYFDLACYRGRHPVENMGDVPALYRHYAKHYGEPLDLPVIAFYTVLFLSKAIIAPLIAIEDKHPGGDWVEGMLQVCFIGRRGMEALAEIIGVELDDGISLPEPHISPLQELATDKLSREIARLPTSRALSDWQRGVLALLPEFLRNMHRYGPWMEAEDLADVAELLGERPRNLVDADTRLAAFIDQAGPEHDAALTRLFYRRTLRQCLVMAGEGAPKEHLLFMKVEPLLGMAIEAEA